MGSIRESAIAQSTKPDIDTTLADIMLGYHFLSDTRSIAVGMGGGIQLSILISEMVAYYNVFKPTVSLKHFVRVVSAADQEFVRLQAEKQARKSNNTNAKGGSNSFPTLPAKQ